MLCLLVKAMDLDFFQVRFLLGEQLVRPFREKPGALQDFLDMQSPSHKTINVQLKRLLSSRVFSGGDVHIAFVVGNVCERLAV